MMVPEEYVDSFGESFIHQVPDFVYPKSFEINFPAEYPASFKEVSAYSHGPGLDFAHAGGDQGVAVTLLPAWSVCGHGDLFNISLVNTGLQLFGSGGKFRETGLKAADPLQQLKSASTMGDGRIQPGSPVPGHNLNFLHSMDDTDAVNPCGYEYGEGEDADEAHG